MKKYRVLIVDDSSFMRRLIRDIINSDPQFEVVGVAVNGKEAIQYNRLYQPDCITLDVEMPVMDGLQALKRIMVERPVPVIMLSSLTQSGTETTVEAMMHGAVDYLQKPTGAFSLDLESIGELLLRKMREAVHAKVSPVNRSKANQSTSGSHSTISKGTSQVINEIVCIGSSTGGPRALQTVLSSLPGDLAAPVLVVQHMPPHFTSTLATRLNQSSTLSVKEAEHGDLLLKGRVYLAPGGSHMKVEKKEDSFYIKLDNSPPIKGLRPCFNVTLDSLIPLGASIIYTILTGMGSDGSEGLRQIKKSLKVYAIAESEETAIIYGMPKVAVQTGLIDQVLKLDDIAPNIVNQLSNIRG